MTLKLPSFLQGQLWKLGAIASGIISIVLVGLLIAANFENRDLVSQRDKLSQTINDPKTGYIAQLSQSRTNVATLTTALDEQKKKFETAAAQNNAKLKQTEAALAAAQARTRDMQRRLDSFLATKPQGATLEERIRDIDARGMTEMVK